MITIFCGEDTVAARCQYIQCIDTYRSTECEIISLPPSSILDIPKGLAENLSLFADKKVFVVENLEKYGFKKSTKAKKDSMYEVLSKISLDASLILIDYEEGKQARQLKLKDMAKVHESKPSTSIFKLLDDCIPGSKLHFIESLRIVCETQDEMFVLIMLFRHIRNLVLANHEALGILPPWQKQKLLLQAKKWDTKQLINFYSGLIKIEIGSKTSSNPYGIAKSLEILACHYL